ncbi:MAG: hypothetical protein AB4372_27265 [Xenococcus sp. (in: cyanobacteria)]
MSIPFSWQKRLQYNFDNFMSKGGFSVFLALLSGFFAAFVLMAILRYLVEWLLPNQYLENYSDLLWEVFVQLIGLEDTGSDANLATKLVSVITIFVGIILFSSLVAFITQQFEERIYLLRKGKSPVLEREHTLILGFNDRILDLIKELIIGNKSKEYAAIVILSEEDKEKMDDFFRNNIADLKTTRLITRNGSVTNLNNLNKVGVQLAKSIVILNGANNADSEEFKALSDARVVKTILAVVAANEEAKLPPILVELHSAKYRIIAKNIAPKIVTIINEANILARILVQTSRYIGLASVYLDLLGFEGNEFYFYRPEIGWQNLTFGELPFHFPRSMPLGLRFADGTLQLNPNKNYKLAEHDEVIVLALDDSTIKFEPQPIIKSHNLFANHSQKRERTTEKHLLIGWNNKTAIALTEYPNYVVPGSEINLLIENLSDKIKTEFEQISQANSDVKMEILKIDTDLGEELKTLKLWEFDSISILASRGTNAEEIDANTLTTLLEIRQMFQDYTASTGNTVTTDLIAEIVNSEDTDLVVKAGVKDCLLSNQLVSKILAQVSQESDVMLIFKELFSAKGSELNIKPISLYFPPQHRSNLTFADCILAAQLRNELCIGVKTITQVSNQEKKFGIKILPSLDHKFNFIANDSLIVLAEDES